MYKIVFPMLLSLLGKQFQVSQLLSEVDECTSRSDEFMAKFRAATGRPMTLKTNMKIQQVALEVQKLLKLNADFYLQLNEYYEPAEALLDEMLLVIQTIRQQPAMREDDVEKLAQELLDNENLQKFLRLDVRKLDAEWEKMNLTEQFQACSDKLTDLTSQLPDETITEADVLSTLRMKLETVKKLIMQGGTLKDIITEIGAEIVETTLTFENLGQFQPMALRLESIWKEHESYMTKVKAAFTTLKNAFDLIVDTDTTEFIRSGRLLSDESFQAAYEVDVDVLQAEWDQLDLIHRAKVFLADLKALETRADRVYQRAYEL